MAKESKIKLLEGIDFYQNDNGKMVLTESFHLKRGTCCGNVCLHCPYNWINVKEPKRTELIKNKNNGYTS